jgi:hypothetical protein
MIEDRAVLSEAIASLTRSVGETSKTRELLEQVEEVFDHERLETVVKQKRSELEETAHRERLILMRGTFNRVAGGAGGEPPVIGITEFDPPRYYGEPGHGASSEPQPMPVPDSVGIRVALPDDSAFTPAGRERIARGDPFYARLIAHSPSYDEATGTLTCAAYAVWGTTRPRPELRYGC